MKATIIIPNYNGKHFLTKCLDALRKQTYKDFDILLVDNASTDGSAEFIREYYPEVKLYVMEENLGFSGGVNFGIKQSTAEFVILLNNDTEADPAYVEELVKAIDRHPKIFSVSSLMEKMYDPGLVDDAGDLYTLMGWAAQRGVDQPCSEYTKKMVVFSACAGAAIYRREVFNEIGYFDEMHFAYLEDLDVGFRARIYGYYNGYAPKAKVFHVGSGTSGSKYNEFKVKLAARNSVYVNYKNQPLGMLLLNGPALLAGYLVKTIFFIKKGYGKEYISGLIEGLKTVSKCKKIYFKPERWLSYILIEMEMIRSTYLYTKEYLKRKIR